MTKKVKLFREFVAEVEEERIPSLSSPREQALIYMINAHAQELSELREEVEKTI